MKLVSIVASLGLLVDGVEGRRSLALVLAIYEAAGLGGENRGDRVKG